MRWARFCVGNLLFAAVFWALSDGVARAEERSEAVLRVHAGKLQPFRIPRNLTGKFCEHLGANIYNGMDAQILRNPTFADYPFATAEGTPDGLRTFQFEREKIEAEVRRQAIQGGWPESEITELLKARNDGLACFWGRAGAVDAVRLSADTGPAGQRAQRIEFKAGGGIKQWTWLPLHRQRKYEFDLFARSPDLKRVRVSVLGTHADSACAETGVEDISGEWRSFKGSLRLPDDVSAEAPYCLVLSAGSAGQLVIAHFFLRPADHIDGADPDVVRLLKAARLPLLRWPGGNFVSAYHWEDGVGPVERRPTLANYAWGGIEPDTFGTGEFMNFCRAVGCEPMICVNAGAGTPEEAARWVQYCNGAEGSAMGARRASHGHAAPFRVRHWEVGNELWGRWQARWTTAAGYVDRYERFAKAMLEADPTIELHACGAPVLWGKAWNDTLIGGLGAGLHSITDHPLIGGDLTPQTDPKDVFRDFMYVPDELERRWAGLRRDLETGGVKDPRLAVTELQMFAHLRARRESQESGLLSQQNLVTPGTVAEALYDTLIYHAAVRLQPFVELITHSATVNHGGGLRKEKERVYPNPCYYANLMFADFAEATPTQIELQTPQEQAPLVLPDLKRVGGNPSFGAVDAVAALSRNGELLVSLVHRGGTGSIRVAIQVDGFVADEEALVSTLSGPAPWTANTLDNPRAVEVVTSETEVRNGSFSLRLEPFSVVQTRLIPKR